MQSLPAEHLTLVSRVEVRTNAYVTTTLRGQALAEGRIILTLPSDFKDVQLRWGDIAEYMKLLVHHEVGHVVGKDKIENDKDLAQKWLTMTWHNVTPKNSFVLRQEVLSQTSLREDDTNQISLTGRVLDKLAAELLAEDYTEILRNIRAGKMPGATTFQHTEVTSRTVTRAQFDTLGARANEVINRLERVKWLLKINPAEWQIMLEVDDTMAQPLTSALGQEAGNQIFAILKNAPLKSLDVSWNMKERLAFLERYVFGAEVLKALTEEAQKPLGLDLREPAKSKTVTPKQPSVVPSEKKQPSTPAPFKAKIGSSPISHRSAKFIERAAEELSQYQKVLKAVHSRNPNINFFGSARIRDEKHPWYRATMELAEYLSKHGYGIVTGGGPGLMEAANRGVQPGRISLGLPIQLKTEERANEFANVILAFKFFFARKFTFVNLSDASISVPGGFGTLDEFFELLALKDLGYLKNYPLILYMKDFWSGFWVLLKDMEKRGLFQHKLSDLVVMLDKKRRGFEIFTQATGMGFLRPP